VWERALAAVSSSGGTVTHHHGVGRLKAAVATREVGAARAGYAALKAELDPAGVMNPGVLYVGEEVLGPVPDERLDPGDGLRRVPARATAAELATGADGEPLWAWEQLPEPARWAREAWQTGWMEVRGRVGGQPVAIGRGPRSAAGPDLRGWVVAQDAEATATIGWTAGQPAWMGEGRPARPWAAARALLRADLRPAVLAVVDGALRVGFRGPACRAFGALAAAAVPGGLREVAWAQVAAASGALEPCGDDDSGVVAVTTLSAWRRPGAADAGVAEAGPPREAAQGDEEPPAPAATAGGEVEAPARARRSAAKRAPSPGPSAGDVEGVDAPPAKRRRTKGEG
jgi:hypothetical protein